ncbi:MAG TPA: hypothetical protein VK760_05915 [Candidatus Acidoferrales bacterium]|jgi:hypothetical protein|nr:hypothetical protein [Candidatus Acidoferrales bacterium]
MRREIAIVVFIAVAAGCSGSPSGAPPLGQVSQPASPARRASTLPASLRGITYDDLSSRCGVSSDELATVQALNHPTVRVVFDPIGPSCYTSGMQALHQSAYTMGELADSSSLKRYSLGQIKARTREYVSALAGSTDVWEIGNEVNGEWLSKVRCPSAHECPAQANDVMSKVQAMYNIVNAHGLTTELTLYYQVPKWVTPGYDMISWERTYVPASMHRGLRYVLVSYYEAGNYGARPTRSQWNKIFTQLAADFPNAMVGFGEIGMAAPITNTSLANAQSIFSYYMSIVPPNVTRFTRAGFWWYAAEDLVPSTKWPTFYQEVQSTL